MVNNPVSASRTNKRKGKILFFYGLGLGFFKHFSVRQKTTVALLQSILNSTLEFSASDMLPIP
jgi:hypothetical protein